MANVRLTIIVLAVVIICCLGTLAEAKKKKKKQERINEKQYYEVIDVIADTGYKICMGLGKLVKERKNFNYRRRCDLFQGVIEELGPMCDTMTKEMGISHQDMVESAFSGGNYVKLQMALKSAAKVALGRRQPTEKKLQQELSKGMNGWMIGVVTGQDIPSGRMEPGKEAEEDKPTTYEEAARNVLQKQGIEIPAFLKDDAIDENSFLMYGEDEWAKKQIEEDSDWEEEFEF